MDDKELQELYLQRNKLNSRIEELERVRLKEAREQNKDLVGRCFKDEGPGSTTYLKVVSTITKYDSDKYVSYLCFVLHPVVMNFELFSFKEELIDTIKHRYLEIDKKEFEEKAREAFERMLAYEG